MKTNEKTSTSQVSSPKGSSVQEEHTLYHPEPPYNSSVMNIRQKKSNIARGFISVKPGAGNVVYCYVGIELTQLPDSYALSIAWQYIKRTFEDLQERYRHYGVMLL